MSGKAMLTCEHCGKQYDPDDKAWKPKTNKVGVYYLEHNCAKWRIVFRRPVNKLIPNADYMGKVPQDYYDQHG